jgi:hypothetical protein
VTTIDIHSITHLSPLEKRELARLHDRIEAINPNVHAELQDCLHERERVIIYNADSAGATLSLSGEALSLLHDLLKTSGKTPKDNNLNTAIEQCRTEGLINKLASDKLHLLRVDSNALRHEYRKTGNWLSLMHHIFIFIDLIDIIFQTHRGYSSIYISGPVLSPLPEAQPWRYLDAMDDISPAPDINRRLRQFLRGAPPSWEALDAAAPRSVLVKALAHTLSAWSATALLLTAPAGEGKSTILKLIARYFLDGSWRIAETSAARGLQLQTLLVDPARMNLVVIDDAEDLEGNELRGLLASIEAEQPHIKYMPVPLAQATPY